MTNPRGVQGDDVAMLIDFQADSAQKRCKLSRLGLVSACLRHLQTIETASSQAKGMPWRQQERGVSLELALGVWKRHGMSLEIMPKSSRIIDFGMLLPIL